MPRISVSRARQCVRAIFRSFRSDGCDAPFVILFLPRTGSNLLAALLDSHPDVLCHHEVFNPQSPFRSLSAREGLITLDLGTAEERDRDPYAFIERVYRTTCGAKAVGFKMSIDDRRRLDVVIALLLNRSIRKIIVRRDSWLHAYTSSLIAEETKAFIKFADERAGGEDGQRRVRVDPEHFVRYVRKRRLAYALLGLVERLTLQRMFTIEYRELKEPGRLNALLRFLGVSANVPLKERTARQNSSRLEDRISNFIEVRDRLAGTSHARYLADE